MMRKCFVVVLTFTFVLALPTFLQAQETKTQNIILVPITQDLTIGVTGGGMVPGGGNIKDRFDVGIPVAIYAKLPHLAKIGNMDIGLGLEIGYYEASAKYGDELCAVPVSLFGDLDLSNLIGLPPVMNLGFELGLGLHMQCLGDSPYNSYLGISPGIVFGYEVIEGLNIFAKARLSEVISDVNPFETNQQPFGGTQEWLDFRIGLSYTFKELFTY